MLQHHLTLFTGQSCLTTYKMLCAFVYKTFLAMWLLHIRVGGIRVHAGWAVLPILDADAVVSVLLAGR